MIGERDADIYQEYLSVSAHVDGASDAQQKCQKRSKILGEFEKRIALLDAKRLKPQYFLKPLKGKVPQLKGFCYLRFKTFFGFFHYDPTSKILMGHFVVEAPSLEDAVRELEAGFDDEKET